ncbi:2-phosphosulfolactate phosphatase [bacterium]|nr:MAG: 2-phosphosulfolactate phosphatase [bacterium]
MRLDVYFTRHELAAAGSEALTGASCVMIDVLRASSTLVQALSVGAGPIYIAGSPEDAFALRDKLGGALLCGERNGLIVHGFDLGNSPLVYTAESVGGRTLVFASTNGSKTLLACENADEILVGGFVNLPAVVEELINADKAALVCSGKLGRYSIEDAVCAGMIIDRLAAQGGKPNLVSDSAYTAVWLYRRYASNPEETLGCAEHALYLSQELGLAEDVAFCTRVGTHNIVPRFVDGVIR